MDGLMRERMMMDERAEGKREARRRWLEEEERKKEGLLKQVRIFACS